MRDSIGNGMLRALIVTALVLVGPLHAANAQCEADGVGEDCNGNGILDACEFIDTLTYDSGALAPIDRLNPQSFTIDNPEMALGDVVMTVSARGDFSHLLEYVFLTFEGYVVGKFFFVGDDCLSVLTEQIVVPMDFWNQFAVAGPIQVNLIPTTYVSANVCPTSFIQVTFDVPVESDADADGNGILDECESANCYGLEATIYVDEFGYVVGGPLDGVLYFGVLIGTSGDDVIVGTDGPDLIVAGKGDDVICAGGGDDHINANHGDDIIDAGEGRDKVNGGGGTDICLEGEKVKNCEG